MHKALIIGSGRIAGGIEGEGNREKPCTHAGAYAMHPEYELCGFVDIDIEKADGLSRKFYTGYSGTHIGRALNEIRPDVVSICVPYRYNLEVMREVLEAYRPMCIFLEKPIAQTVADGVEITRLCRSAGVRLYVNNRRLFATSIAFKALLAEETAGKPVSITCWCTSGLFAMGIHMVDLMRYFFGEIEWVHAREEIEKVDALPYSTNFDPSDFSASAMIGFSNGSYGHFVNTALTDYQYNELMIITQRKRYLLFDNGTRIRASEMLPPAGTTISYKLGNHREIDVPSTPLFLNVLDEMLNDGGDESPVYGNENLKSLAVIESIRHSARTRSILRLADAYPDV